MKELKNYTKHMLYVCIAELRLVVYKNGVVEEIKILHKTHVICMYSRIKFNVL